MSLPCPHVPQGSLCPSHTKHLGIGSSPTVCSGFWSVLGQWEACGDPGKCCPCLGEGLDGFQGSSLFKDGRGRQALPGATPQPWGQGGITGQALPPLPLVLAAVPGSHELLQRSSIPSWVLRPICSPSKVQAVCDEGSPVLSHRYHCLGTISVLFSATLPGNPITPCQGYQHLWHPKAAQAWLHLCCRRRVAVLSS